MSSDSPLRLSGELSIVEAATQRQLMLEGLGEAGNRLQLDLSAIEGCDSAGVQLLLALQRSLAARGGTLQLLAAPPCVQQALATYGLTAQLPCADGVAA